MKELPLFCKHKQNGRQVPVVVNISVVVLADALWNKSDALSRLLQSIRTGETRSSSEPPRTRQRQRRLSDAEIEAVVAGYQSGETVAELAGRLGSHRVTVAKHLRAAGVRLRLDPLTVAEVDEAARLYESGLSLAKVGERIGATARTIQLRLRERGVETRDTHGRPIGSLRNDVTAPTAGRALA